MLITAPAAAALTQTDPNALRQIHLIPILVLITSLGASLVSKKIVAISITAALIEFVIFINWYFTSFPERAKPFFDYDYVTIYPYIHDLKGTIIVHNMAMPVTTKFLSRSYFNTAEAQVIHRNEEQTYDNLAYNVYTRYNCEKLISRYGEPMVQLDTGCIYPPFATISPQ
jgi:hypothetical protein